MSSITLNPELQVYVFDNPKPLMQVYVFDNCGQGLSVDTDPAPLTIHTMASSTVDLIKALGLSQPDIWGTSMGGAITLEILAEHGGAVRRAVSVAGLPGGNATYTPQVAAQPGATGIIYRFRGRVSQIHPM